MIELTEQEIKSFHKGHYTLGPNECWEWFCYKQKSGHGHTRIRKKTYYAHRIAYAIANKDWNEGLCVLHKCDNPACCNPNHLFLGTRKDNMDDKVSKGRQTRGDTNAGVLVEWQVREIKEKYSTGLYTQAQLGKEYDVHQSAISRIVAGLRWCHTNV